MLEVLRERMKRCQQRGGQIKLLRSPFHRCEPHTSSGMDK